MASPLRYGVAFAAVLAVSASAALADSSKPIRHLVYSFTIGLSTDLTEHSSGIGGDGPVSGLSDYHAGNTDKGQIVVDVMQVQPDTGLVMQISEHARDTRSSVPTMCVVYGNGAVICDPSQAQPNEEEFALMRVLGRNFVNRGVIDAKNHWHYSSQEPNAVESSDYTITKDNGGMLNISYQRVLHVSGGQPFNATTDGTMLYDEKTSAPASIVEDTITRKTVGMGQDSRSDQKIALNLVTDSMQQAATTTH